MKGNKVSNSVDISLLSIYKYPQLKVGDVLVYATPTMDKNEYYLIEKIEFHLFSPVFKFTKLGQGYSSRPFTTGFNDLTLLNKNLEKLWELELISLLEQIKTPNQPQQKRESRHSVLHEMHLQAQVERILDEDLGGVVSDQEYRGVGKTYGIALRIVEALLWELNGDTSQNELMFVRNSEQKRRVKRMVVDILNERGSTIYKHYRFNEVFDERVVVVNGELRGFRLRGDEIVYLDGIDRYVYDHVLKPMCRGNNIKLRGFINL